MVGGSFVIVSQGAPVTSEEIPQVFRRTVGRVPFSSRQANTHISTSKIALNQSSSCNFARLNTHTSGVGSPSRHRLVTVSSSSRVARRAVRDHGTGRVAFLHDVCWAAQRPFGDACATDPRPSSPRSNAGDGPEVRPPLHHGLAARSPGAVAVRGRWWLSGCADGRGDWTVENPGRRVGLPERVDMIRCGDPVPLGKVLAEGN